VATHLNPKNIQVLAVILPLIASFCEPLLNNTIKFVSFHSILESALNATETVLQVEEHVLLDCLRADLAELRMKRHHLFHTLFCGSSRLRFCWPSGHQRTDFVCAQVPRLLYLGSQNAT